MKHHLLPDLPAELQADLNKWLPTGSECINALTDSIKLMYGECANSHIENAQDLFAHDLTELILKWAKKLNLASDNDL